jgi:hypothetical protein
VTTRAYRPAVLLGVNLRTVNRQPVPAIAARLESQTQLLIVVAGTAATGVAGLLVAPVHRRAHRGQRPVAGRRAHHVSLGWAAPVAVLLALTLSRLLPGMPAARPGRIGHG